MDSGQDSDLAPFFGNLNKIEKVSETFTKHFFCSFSFLAIHFLDSIVKELLLEMNKTKLLWLELPLPIFFRTRCLVTI